MLLKSFLSYNLKLDRISGFHQTNAVCTYEPTESVMVLMLAGHEEKWKQPIGYFFVSSTCTGENLKYIIFNAIEKIFAVGLNVKCFITDSGSNFVQFIKNFPRRAVFFVNNQKIFYVCDVPYLLKATQNNFLKTI